MIRCSRSHILIAIVLGTLVMMPQEGFADAPACNAGTATYRFVPEFSTVRSAVASSKRGALQFDFDRALMPRLVVDAQIGTRHHVRFELQAQNASTEYEVTSIAIEATYEYRFSDRSSFVVIFGPHPALTANERFAVDYVIHT